MKGVILAGGTGSRLAPCTNVTNKHLLPVYNKPMIFFPLMALKKAGIKDVLIIVGGNSVGDFLRLLGSGKQFGMSLTYKMQDSADGIAGALRLAEPFAGNEPFAVILGDNIFESGITDVVNKFARRYNILDDTHNAMIVLKKVPNPHEYGVVEFEPFTLDTMTMPESIKIMNIVEKPKIAPSDYAVVGLYFYPPTVFKYISNLSPSERGELEITDVNKMFVEDGLMKYVIYDDDWYDAGTLEGILISSNKIHESKKAKEFYHEFD